MTEDVKTVIRHIRVSANEWVQVYGNMEYPPNLKLAIMAADALEAATVAPAVDREALVEWFKWHADPNDVADALLASGILRDVRDVQAETLEQAAGDFEPLGYVMVTNILRMGAQAIREARSER